METRRTLYSLLCILLLWWGCDRVGGWLMWQLSLRSHDTTSPKLHCIAKGVPEEVVLMGTSRCNGHYVPSILRDSLGMSVFNAGVDGSDNIYSQYIALRLLLRHHTPKVVCLELESSFLEKEDDAFSTTSFFAPFVGTDAHADSIFRLAGTLWRYRLSHLYRFNAKALPIITGQLRNYWQNEDQGYIPNPEPAVFPHLQQLSEAPQPVDSLKLQVLERFIGDCRERGITLVFTISPAFYTVQPSHYAALRLVARRHAVPLFDYHTQGLYQEHPELFRDINHLWDRGARLYTSLFAGDLRRVLRREPPVR